MVRMVIPALAGLVCIGIVVGCNAAAEDGGEGGGSYGDATSGTGVTKASAGTGYGATTGAGFGSGTTGSGSVVDPPASPDPLEPFVPVECAALDPSQPAVLYLSADDSNSMASPARARAALAAGVAPGGDVRTFEFLNYYRVDYPGVAYPDVAAYVDLRGAVTAGDYDLQIGVRAFEAVKPRRPITLTLVLDRSGSMEGERMERLKATVTAMSSQLRAGDIVSAVAWNTTNSVLIAGHEVSGPNDPTIASLVSQLQADGETNLNAGLVAGYELAEEHYGPARLNRVVVISDGEANAGVTDEELIAEHAEDADQEGIYLVGVAVGPGGNDALMNVVTDKGRGASVFVDSIQEAQTLFTTRFDEIFEVAARSVQVELTLPWYFQVQDFFGEEMSTDPTEVEPQHLAPGDTMVLSQVIRACDPSMVLGADTVRVRVEWTTPITYQPDEVVFESTIDALLAAPAPALAKGKAIVAYAEALKTGSSADLQAARATVLAANPGGADAELEEIAALLAAHPSY